MTHGQNLARGTAAAVLGTLLVGLTACAPIMYSDAYVAQRQANLDAAVAEFDAEMVAEFVCDFGGGKVGLNSGLERTHVLRGATSWAPTLDTLEQLDYSIQGFEAESIGHRAEGIRFVARLIPAPGAEPDLEEQMKRKDCEVPAEGATYLRFVESDAGER